MPPLTRTATPGPSTTTTSSKRPISDTEPTPKDSKRLRRDSSTDPTHKTGSNRDSKRRKRRKRKAPIVATGVAKSETASAHSDERLRAPLSSRNEIIRFSSSPPEGDPSPSVTQSAHTLTRDVSSKPPSVGGDVSSQTLDDTTEDQLAHEPMPSTPRDTKHAIPTDQPAPGPSNSSLEEKVAQLTAELKSKNDLITSHQGLVNQIQQAATCQICLDLMYKPYALAPCGHLACHDCLVQWFTAPPADNRPAPPPMMRRKTCPHCRAAIKERPVEVWGVKGIAQALGKSGLTSAQAPAPVDAPENSNANADPWKDIFPKAGRGGRNGLHWFFPGADIDDDDDDIHLADVAPRGEDVGMLDMEDGGIYRCLDCMHEIWDGVCSSCGRVYPGHRQEGEDEGEEGDVHPFGWFDEQMGAEEIDIADDPGWMGLEDGEADDDGDGDEWQYIPWRGHFRMFRGPLSFLGAAIHVDDMDDVDEDGNEEDHGDHGAIFLDDDAEESEDDGYESSFIDDEGAGAVGLEHGRPRPRIYEIDDEDEDYHAHLQQQVVDLASDDDEEDADADELQQAGGAWAGRRRAAIVVSSDEENGEDVDGSEADFDGRPRWLSEIRRRRGPIVESDGSDGYLSDE